MKTKNLSYSTLSCILKSIRFSSLVTNKKIILALAFVVFLNGCVQSTSMLGPAYTFSSSGSVLQTGLSYGSNKVYAKYKDEKKNKELQEITKVEKINDRKTRKRTRRNKHNGKVDNDKRNGKTKKKNRKEMG